jgi:uncharacterized protein YbaP (TraB family)
MRLCLAALSLAAGLASAPALAQTPAETDHVDTLDEIVVTARRSGVPVWRIGGEQTRIIIVGSIASVPADTPWRPEALEAAVTQADQVILSQTATMSLADFFRMRRARARLPEGKAVSDYLTPDWQARLAALERTYRQDYSRRGLVWIAQDLRDRLRYRPGVGPSAEAVVRAAARKAGRPVQEVGDLDARHIDDAIAQPDANQTACLTAAIAASEAGAPAIRARGEAWTRQEVPAVIANPAEQVQDRCVWFADQTLRGAGRRQWSQAAADALGQDRITMMVLPLTVAAEPGGVLDQLEAAGLQIRGPAWKKPQ